MIEVEVEAEAVVVVVKREVEAVSVVVEGEEAKVAVVEGEVKQVEAGLEEQSVQDHISFVLYSISVNCLAYPCTASTISTFILTLMFHIFICELCVLATNYSVDDDFCYKRVQTPGMSPPRAGAWTYCLFTP